MHDGSARRFGDDTVESAPDAIILCGGAGTRLRSVTGNSPKSMASVAGRPFLELLFEQLRLGGVRRAILAVGYLKESIQSAFGDEAYGLKLAYSEETSPLGTGGALRKAADLIETGMALAMNGDSYVEVDLGKLVTEHREQQAAASIVVVPVDERNDSGSVSLNVQGFVTRFQEKQPDSRAPYINAGVYLISRALLQEIPAGVATSVEKQVFPDWLAAGRAIRGHVVAGPCVDIGTPERYEIAQALLANVSSATGVRAGDVSKEGRAE